MTQPVRMTLQTLKVLRVLLVHPAEDNFGLRIAQRCDLPTGSVYPILARLEAAGWLASKWENINESVEGRRARREYSLTSDGRKRALEAIAEAQQTLEFNSVNAGWWARPVGNEGR